MLLNGVVLVVLSILCTIVALPVQKIDTHSVSYDKYRREVAFDSFLHPRSDEVFERELFQLFERGGQKSPRRRPGPPIITFGKQARKDLDDLGLHGKERRKAKKYHKAIIKEHMKSIPGAHTADVARIAHLGGSTPGDPLHATVAYRRKPPSGQTLSKTQTKKLLIPSSYTDSNGAVKKGGLHHVYPKKKSHHLPASYAAAERARAGLAPGAPIPHKH
ncbi:hypothetical protein CVT26_008607 [Gymnopilus dilepis]|uniref:Uncharacterized protein n=1 Tax=Gymnopilus dilepis TaxID=231916 RepID=A0A409XXT9_9AGAR|nr:hypothetical protein CVT26_008607 [Gymnopilus dilepis]